MANSSFFKNTGTSTQIQGSANASAAAALASEQAALVSKNAAATSETNAAASAAAALVSKNAAATSAASANSDASAASISATASQTAATTSSANVALTSADATQTAADRVQTGLDRVATNSDAVQTAADRVQTGLDVTSSGASAAAALSSRNAAATSETNAAASAASSSADATATASDRVQTGLDAASTAADAIATAADRVQTGLDATASANSASAASTSATAAAASQVSAASSAASAAAVFNDFEDRYYGPHASDSAAQTYIVGQGLTVDQGDLYFNSTANEMRVYDGGSWIAASSAGGASLINYHFTATAAQTAFTGADDNSNTLSYTVDNLIVTRNGVVLEDGTDYTATSGTSIALAVAAAAGDEINVVAFKSFTTADMVSATNGGTFQSNVTVNGTMTATAFSGNGSALTGITIPTLSSLGIANHDQVTVTAGGAVTATSFSGDGSALTGIPTPTLTSLGIANHDDITVDGSGNVGIGTTTNNQSSSTASVTLNAASGMSAYELRNADVFSGYLGNNGTNMYLVNAKNGSLGLYTNNTERMHLTSTGGVGIGTTSVAYRMNIFGNGNNFLQFSSTGDAVAGHLIGRGGSKNLRIQNSENANIEFMTNNTERMRITSTGNVGIGTTNPLAKLNTYGADALMRLDDTNGGVSFIGHDATGAYWRTFTTDTHRFLRASGVESMRIDGSGRVTMPSQPAFSFTGLNNTWATTGNFQTLVPASTKINRGNHYNGNTGVFTAPVSGVYFFGFWGLVYLNSGQLINWRYSLNGGYGSQLVQSTGSTGNHTNTSGSVILSLSANDTVTLDAGLSNQTAATPYYTQWNMYGYLMF